jgi:endoglucanase
MRVRALCGASLTASLVVGLLLAGTTSAGPLRRPHIRSTPKISGAAVSGKTLSAARGRWSNRPTVFKYVWQRCNSAGKSCRKVSAARRKKYRLGGRDVGRRMRVVVTAFNRVGHGVARSKPTKVVALPPGAPPPPTPPPPPVPPPPPPSFSGLHVSGNQLLNGSNQVVHLHGVNRSGLEYACVQGWGIFDGPSDDASVAAIASWHSNIVHIGLNEDCILGINGVAAQYSGANYMTAVVAFVNRLHAHNLYAEVSLMWAAPGSQQALDHPPILDADHAPAALKAIANAFKGDPNTIIGLQSEPHGISWACWKNGGASCSVGYTALGMQGALDAVRSTGATNVVTASGINWANDISQWLTYRPTDSAGQFMAETHVYGNNACASTSCMNTQMAPVAAAVPLVFGETGETYDASSCGSTNIQRLMGWADAHGVGYQAWVWNDWGNCSALITDYDGTPANAYATWVRDHYLTFPAP